MVVVAAIVMGRRGYLLYCNMYYILGFPTNLRIELLQCPFNVLVNTLD